MQNITLPLLSLAYIIIFIWFCKYKKKPGDTITYTALGFNCGLIVTVLLFVFLSLTYNYAQVDPFFRGISREATVNLDIFFSFIVGGPIWLLLTITGLIKDYLAKRKK
jgi:hypothetical protein